MKGSLSKILFWTSYILIIISTFCIEIDFVEPYIKYMKIIAIVLLIFKCLIQSKTYNVKTILIIILLSILGIITFFTSKDETFIILLLFIFSLKDISFENLVKKDFYIKLIILLFIFIMYFCGYTSEYLISRNHNLRNTFGFAHPNVLGFMIVMLNIEYIYINKEKFKITYLLICFISLIFIYIYPNSRSSIILLIMMSVMCLLIRTNFKKILYVKPVKFLIKNSFFIFTLLTIIFTFLLCQNNKVGITLDSIFSRRLYFIENYLEKYNVNLFGNDLLFVSSEVSGIFKIEPSILDNLFILILLQYGIIVYFVFGYLFNKSFDMAYKNNNIFLIIILFILMAYGMMENYIFKCGYNVFIFYFGNILYKRENKSLKK